ncbi:enoyl-CoA hydratase [Sulfodiicoccus acidiphilus]|uniref:Enoyl-CoA hydratase n=1 Tax=Sulfodiicoccus acidiphilus TaxID=1670455 RepID=A0A348B1W2_9CREN|nr:enoyl-CoA hydratase/isomerase family protein [Sulfodiicoccus acidiphilus]BBD72164.1 enoyl-CoA hydratase [Sulfodiicoccus acidiphilus]GGT94548.1 enoyl-CoA hydratase [Sulfodiicoccus acidiphilus]
MIRTTVHDESGIGEVVIERPEKMNAITLQGRREVGEAMRFMDSNPQVRVVVVKGAGNKSFSSGGDVGEFLNTNVDDLLKWGEDLSTAEKISKPVVASINGYTFGAGLELALSCDIRIATSKSLFALPEVKLGMVPASGGITRLVKMVGLSRATYLLMLGKRIDAGKALEYGLIHEVVEEDELEPRTLEVAKELATLSPLALKALKGVLRTIADAPFDAALDIERKTFGLLRYSEDFKEGVNSFLNRREPRFSGK